MLGLSQKLAAIAKEALYEELITYPKPGLVSHIDQGSHSDMDYFTFLNSIEALEKYFNLIAKAGYEQQNFACLRNLGIKAEQQMLEATINVNTHRGAIFILGLLIAASAACLMQELPFKQISSVLISNYGQELTRHGSLAYSHGSQVRKQYKTESLIDAAAKGFPFIFSVLGHFEQYLQKYGYEEAKLLSFFVIMANLDDTNLIYRGGMAALFYAREEAKKILNLTSASEIKTQTVKLHHEFILYNLSPGGCADILAAVIFLFEVKKLWQ